MSFKDDLFFFFSPRIFVDSRIKMIMPSRKELKKSDENLKPLTALLARSAFKAVDLFHFLRDNGPFTNSEFFDKFSNCFIFLKRG